MAKRLKYLDAAKALCLMLVVVAHTEAARHISYTVFFRLPLFWFAAGFTCREVGSLSRKFKKLIIPYLLLTAVCLAFVFYTEGFSWERIWGALYGRNLLLPLGAEGNKQLLPWESAVLWFLPSLFIAYCVLKLILLAKTTRMQGALCLISLVIATVADKTLPVLLPWSIDTAFFIAPIMWCGREAGRRGLPEQLPRWGIAALVLVYAASVYFGGDPNWSLREYGQSMWLSFGGAVAGALLFLWLMQKIENTRVTDFLCAYNKQALTAFGLQILMIELSCIVAQKLGLPDDWMVLPELIGGLALGWLAGKGLDMIRAGIHPKKAN